MMSIPMHGGHTSSELRLQLLNPTQHWSHWRSWGYSTPVQGPQEVNLPCPAYGSGPQKVVTPQPALGFTSPMGPRGSSCLDLPRDPILGRLSCLNLPGDSISRRLSCLSLPGDLHPDPGMPGSQIATVLDRISFRKTHP